MEETLKALDDAIRQITMPDVKSNSKCRVIEMSAHIDDEPAGQDLETRHSFIYPQLNKFLHITAEVSFERGFSGEMIVTAEHKGSGHPVAWPTPALDPDTMPEEGAGMIMCTQGQKLSVLLGDDYRLAAGSTDVIEVSFYVDEQRIYYTTIDIRPEGTIVPTNEPDLNRFLLAQNIDNSYDMALKELRNCRKEGHWIWYVCPQVKGLGHSEMAWEYGLDGVFEAYAYLDNYSLKNRLCKISGVLVDIGSRLPDVVGGLDALKIRSCMTLFDLVEPGGIFNDVLRYCFDGERDPLTLERTKEEYDFLRGDCPLIREAAEKFDYRAFFETGICESDGMDDDLRAATVLDAILSGYSMNDLVRWYICHKDFTPYRLGGVDSCIDNQLQCLKNYLMEKAVTGEQMIQVRDCFRPFDEQETHDVYETAARYDRIVTSLMRGKWMLGALREYRYVFSLRLQRNITDFLNQECIACLCSLCEKQIKEDHANLSHILQNRKVRFLCRDGKFAYRHFGEFHMTGKGIVMLATGHMDEDGRMQYDYTPGLFAGAQILMKDVNGIDIYTGDVVLPVSEYYTETFSASEVRYKRGVESPGIGWDNHDFIFSEFPDIPLKVIGNCFFDVNPDDFSGWYHSYFGQGMIGMMGHGELELSKIKRAPYFIGDL